MMNIDALFSAVSVPTWLAVLAGFAAILLLVILFRPNSERDPLSLFAQFALLAVVAGAAFFGLNRLDETARLADRRGLEERAAALGLQAVQPGSAIACVDAAADKALTQACERNLFAEPQRVAAGLALARERLALVADALNYAAGEPAYVERIAPMRRAVEADPYGFVAFVLASDDKCTADSCARFRLLRDTNRVRENLRERRFETLVAKYSEAWQEPKPQARTETGTPGSPAEPPAPVLTPSPPPGTSATVPGTPRVQPKQKEKAKENSGVRPRRPPEPVAGLPPVIPSHRSPVEDDDTPPPPQTSGVRPPNAGGPRQN
jgi:hypothetical protein